MTVTSPPVRAARLRPQSGVSLLEAQVALFLLTIAVVGTMGTLAAQQRHVSQGEKASRVGGVVRPSARQFVLSVTTLTTAATCRVQPVAIDVQQQPPVVRVRVFAR